MTQKVKYRLEFEVSDSWKSGESACWTECPFSPLIGLGHTCKFLTTKELKCPFRDNKFKTLIERDCTVEVRHGTWIANRSPVEVEFSCSECGFSYIEADSYQKCDYNFCPKCGARMDGDKE